jgi:hypothetical protein
MFPVTQEAQEVCVACVMLLPAAADERDFLGRRCNRRRTCASGKKRNGRQ